MLTENVRHFLASDSKFHLWVYLFYNKRGLLDTFARVGHSSARLKFDDFIIGFNQAAERFLVVDVGGSKEAADAKIKGYLTLSFYFLCPASPQTRCAAVYLEDNIRLPQTHKILFGGISLALFHYRIPITLLGSHDNGYVNVLRSVITEGYRDKLILMPGYADIALDIKALSLPELRIPDLFIASKLVAPSYISIASYPPPGLPVTPKLAAQTASVQQISNSSTTSSATATHLFTDISNPIPGRNSIQSYKSAALQTGRSEPAPYEASDSSASTDANDAHPAQLIQFTRRMSSPGRLRRLNPKLVEFVTILNTRSD